MTQQHKERVDMFSSVVSHLTPFRRTIVFPCRYCGQSQVNKRTHWRTCIILQVSCYLGLRCHGRSVDGGLGNAPTGETLLRRGLSFTASFHSQAGEGRGGPGSQEGQAGSECRSRLGDVVSALPGEQCSGQRLLQRQGQRRQGRQGQVKQGLMELGTGVAAGGSRSGMDYDGRSLEGLDLESSNRGIGRAAGGHGRLDCGDHRTSQTYHSGHHLPVPIFEGTHQGPTDGVGSTGSGSQYTKPGDSCLGPGPIMDRMRSLPYSGLSPSSGAWRPVHPGPLAALVSQQTAVSDAALAGRSAARLSKAFNLAEWTC